MKNKVVILLSILMLIFLSGCAPKYAEPMDPNKTAKLVVDLESLRAIYNFPIVIVPEVDGQVIAPNHFPRMQVNVLEGKRKVAFDIIAYYKRKRAKYSYSKEYEIDFKANQVYVISAKIKNHKLENFEDNVKATYTIKGINVDISEEVTLEDSALRSTNGASQEEINRTVTDAVIQSVVIPMML